MIRKSDFQATKEVKKCKNAASQNETENSSTCNEPKGNKIETKTSGRNFVVTYLALSEIYFTVRINKARLNESPIASPVRREIASTEGAREVKKEIVM
jgi:hypothetical protein